MVSCTINKANDLFFLCPQLDDIRLSFHLRIGFSSDLFLPFRFSYLNFICISHLSHLILLDLVTIMTFSSSLHNCIRSTIILPCCVRMLASELCSKSTSAGGERPSFWPIQNNGNIIIVYAIL